MDADLSDLNAFAAVAAAGGFREAARANSASASGLSEAVRRLESRLGLRLLNRTTRSVVPTEAGARLLDRLVPALAEVGAAYYETYAVIPIVHDSLNYGMVQELTWAPRQDGFMLVKEMSFA